MILLLFFCGSVVALYWINRISLCCFNTASQQAGNFTFKPSSVSGFGSAALLDAHRTGNFYSHLWTILCFEVAYIADMIPQLWESLVAKPERRICESHKSYSPHMHSCFESSIVIRNQREI